MNWEDVVTLFFLSSAIVAYLCTLAWQIAEDDEEDE